MSDVPRRDIGNETVSVILPYFNRADTLERAARSVLQQTHEDLILVMVNDGSSDGSREVAHSMKDARIVHVDAPVNGGACAARNLGLEAAETDLVGFQDSDDVWLPEKLDRQIKYLRQLQREGESVSVLGCGWRYRDRVADLRTFDAGPFGKTDMLRGVAGTGTPMLLVDRAVAAEAKFDLSLPSLEERDYVLSCLSNGSRLAVTPEVLAVVTRGRQDHVANPRGASAAWERYLAKYTADFRDDSELRSWYHFRAAREYLVAGQRQLIRPHLSEALKFKRTRRTIHLGLGCVAGVRGLAVAQRVVPL